MVAVDIVGSEAWNWLTFGVLACVSLVVLMPVHRAAYRRANRRTADPDSAHEDFVSGVIRVDTLIIRWSLRGLAVLGLVMIVLLILDTNIE